MIIAKVKLNAWDRPGLFAAEDLVLRIGDKVIVRSEQGLDLGRVIALFEREPDAPVEMPETAPEAPDGTVANATPENTVPELRPVIRLATQSDLDKEVPAEEKERVFKVGKELIASRGLPMKLVDVLFSFDGSRLTFAFTADGRVDFRELVKDLTRNFGRNIRLQQIGIRDEAKIRGDIGHCGRQLCCKTHLLALQSITSEMAEVQQCAHRGSDRLSGSCGRLMCCLAYENKGYESMGKEMPPLGAKVKVDGKRGTIVGHHLLKRTVKVEFPGEKGEHSQIVEVDLDRHKKKEKAKEAPLAFNI